MTRSEWIRYARMFLELGARRTASMCIEQARKAVV